MNRPYATLMETTLSLEGATTMLNRAEADAFESLPEFFDLNQDRLDQIRGALRQKPSIPLEYHPDWLPNSVHSKHAMRLLSCIFGAELRLAIHRREFERACEIAIDGLDLANAMRRGGLLLDAVFSNGCSGDIHGLLVKIRSQLSAKERSWLIDELSRVDSERESFASIEERDKKWEGIVGSFTPEDREIDRLMDELEAGGEIFADEHRRGAPTEGLRALMKEHFKFGKASQRRGAPLEVQRALMKEVYEAERKSTPVEVTRMRMLEADLCELCVMRLLAADLRVRSYKEEQGSYPESLEQLKACGKVDWPIDPCTGKPFRYRKTDEVGVLKSREKGFDLYSPGPKAIDRGGIFGGWNQVTSGEADLCLDWANYETSG